MPCSNTAGGISALFRVFVLPALKSPRPELASRRLIQPHASRGLSQTSHRLAPKPTPREAREPEKRREKWNEEITARIIQLADPETGVLHKDTTTRRDVMVRLNQETHRLVQFSDGQIPVCKILSKKDMYEHEKKKKQDAREKKLLLKTAVSVKTLELNWAIDENDLGHRLAKVKGFLEEGRKVEIVLAAKKRGKGRQANPQECEALLTNIQKAVDSIQGARQLKALDGKLGGFATLTLIGPSPQAQQPTPANV